MNSWSRVPEGDLSCPLGCLDVLLLQTILGGHHEGKTDLDGGDCTSFCRLA